MQNTGTGAPGNGRIPLGGTMTEEHLQFTVGDREVSGLRVLPENQAPACTLVYAPGAGSNLQDPFGKYLAERLGGAGITTVRFQFPYMEEAKRRPDSPGLLEETWIEVLRITQPINGRLVVGGRSMGGRIASQVVAQGMDVDALALFAYPLHPPSNPDKRRDGHLPKISVPTLFCSGTRDTFASAEELAEAASKVPEATVHHLNGADHGFAVLKSSGRTRADVWSEAVDSLLSWISEPVFKDMRA